MGLSCGRGDDAAWRAHFRSVHVWTGGRNPRRSVCGIRRPVAIRGNGAAYGAAERRSAGARVGVFDSGRSHRGIALDCADPWT